MNSFVKHSMKGKNFISAAAGIALVISVSVLFSAPAFGQNIPQPTPAPSVAPSPVVSPIPLPTPVVSPPAPAPPTDIPNLNDNPPELPDIPAAPPLDVPDYDSTPRALPSPLRVGVDLENQTTLSLDDAIRLGLENNNDIEIAEFDVKTAELDLTIADAGYIPQIAGESFFRRSTTPVASSLSGSADGSLTETSFRSNLSLSGKVPFQGGSYTTTIQADRTSTNNTFTSLNPQYPTSFRIEYTQPLFRGRKIDQTRRQIEISKKNLTLSDAQFRQRTVEIIAQVEAAYWDLTYALRNLQVQLDGVSLANTQVASNERQVIQGVLAPSDVLAARSQVATFEQNVYVAQQTVTQAENNLKNLILADRTSPIWNNPIVPVTPLNLNFQTADLQSSIIAALANRQEITQLETTKEINDIDKDYFRDQLKPQIDLVGSYTSAGLAGSPLESSGVNPLTAGLQPLIGRINELSTIQNLPPLSIDTSSSGSSIPGNLDGGYFQSFTNVLLQRYPTYQIGVRISLPFKNTAAEANLGKTLVAESRIKSQRDKTELAIETEVRNALQAVRSQESRLAASTNARVANEQLYESEQRKNLAGTSTTFIVLQRQTDLINARGREVQAQTDLNKAITQYQHALGTILDSAGITFNDRSPSFSKPKRTQITTVFGKPTKNLGNSSID